MVRATSVARDRHDVSWSFLTRGALRRLDLTDSVHELGESHEFSNPGDISARHPIRIACGGSYSRL